MQISNLLAILKTKESLIVWENNFKPHPPAGGASKYRAESLKVKAKSNFRW